MKLSVIAFLILISITAPAKAVEFKQTPQNAFATELYAKLSQKTGNIFFSPYSISMAMSMTFMGAKGDTANEIAKALHIDEIQSGAQGSSLKNLLLEKVKKDQVLEAHQKGMELHMANALWGKEGYAFNQEFIANIKNNFQGNFEPVNFSNEPLTRKKINDWVEGQTKGKIKDLIPQNALTNATRLVLTNAIYFKAEWQDKFEKSITTKDDFYTSEGKNIKADMMKRIGHYDLAELDGFKLLIMPYQGFEASMIILLPDQKNGLEQLEKELNAIKLTSWLAKTKDARVALKLPKFATSSTLNLNSELMSLGIQKAFNPAQADFTNMANVTNDPLYIGQVLHKAFVDVDENGTEAAAATAIMMAAGAMPPKDEPIPFVADHPFLYLIRSQSTGEIFFMGRLSDPTQKG